MAKKEGFKEKSKKVKRDVKEIFNIKKGGKEKTIERKGKEEEVVSTKNQIKEENNVLKNILLGIGIILGVILVFWLVGYSINNFKYEGVKFNIIKEGNLVFYHTTLPVLHEGKKDIYNFYLRNDPRKSEVPFEGEIYFMPNMVINMTEDFACDGDGIIAIANLVNLYSIMGTKVIKDENADCDPEGKYEYLNILPGNETKIEKYGPVCYKIYIKDCEILEGTEKFMIKTFAELEKKIG